MSACSSQLQTNNKTFLGRYWTEYSVLRRYFASDQQLSILSFGCATGEELATLRMHFPGARLYGCDTDWYSLQAARALLADKATIFTSSEQELLRHGPYDIVVCNSVLLRPTTALAGRKLGIDSILWSDVLSRLDSVLKPGGVMQIICSNIPFRYHPAFNRYQPLRSPLILGPSFVDIFNPQGSHLCSGVPGTGCSSILNRHLGEEAWKEMLPTDLHDVHFQKSGGSQLPSIEEELLANMPRGEAWASGSMTYRPEIPPDPRPSTHIEIDTTWTALAADSVRLERRVRRIWFDGTVVLSCATASEMMGSPATNYIEAAIGRRSTILSLDEMSRSKPVRSSSL